MTDPNMRYSDLTCIRCGREMRAAGNWEDAPPSEGLLFTSHGNYGSRIYDEPATSGNYLVIAICDRCVLAEAARRNIMENIPVRKIVRDVREPWNPADVVKALEEADGHHRPG